PCGCAPQPAVDHARRQAPGPGRYGTPLRRPGAPQAGEGGLLRAHAPLAAGPARGHPPGEPAAGRLPVRKGTAERLGGRAPAPGRGRPHLARARPAAPARPRNGGAGLAVVAEEPTMRRLCILVLLGAACVGSVRAGDLRAGAAAVDITPPVGTPLAGYY